MVARIVESLTATIAVGLTRLDGQSEREVFSDVGQHAGLEIAGDLPAILDGYAKKLGR